MSTAAVTLSTQDLTVRYGGVVANDHVSITVAPGEIVGLIGPNGAGKTTFVDAVTGYTAAAGEVRLGSQRIDHLPPHARRRAGLARTWQAGELFGDLTVRQNLAVALEPPGWRSVIADIVHRQSVPTEVSEALALLELDDVADRRPAELTLGRQKLVGVARALVGSSAVVLLDEPAAGLDSHESLALGADLRRIVEHGSGMLLIDHDMALVLETCDRVYVMDFGKVIADGTPDQVRSDPAVTQAYLGSAVAP